MFHLMQILTISVIGVALAPALAHAFEFPGKRRLKREVYITVQAIYYPGFTLLGVSEPAGVIAVFVLLLLTPFATISFWLTSAALISMLGMQGVYWMFTHPTNKFWLQTSGARLGTAGKDFFTLNPAPQLRNGSDGDWTRLRDRWEYSHIARAGLAFISFLLIVIATVVRD